MTTFKVGDKVRIKTKRDFDFDILARTVEYVEEFDDYCGQVATIKKVDKYGKEPFDYIAYNIDLDHQAWYWHESQFELVQRADCIGEDDLYFAKVRPTANIPSKRDEDAGYDIYANFEDDAIVIKPNETKLIPTGICSAFSEKYVAILKERGSTGTKGMGQRCGVIDSGFRGEWFVPITNHNNRPIVIVKKDVLLEDFDCIIYPYEKAICQAVMVEVPKLQVKEVDLHTIKNFKSERQDGALGSSKK